MTTSQADPAFSSAEETSNPANPITDPAAGAEVGGTTTGGAMGANLKDQLSFAAKHRAPTTKDVETNRWTGAAPGTLKKGQGGLHGGGVVPDGWTPEDGPVGGNASGTGVGGSGVGRTDPLDREGLDDGRGVGRGEGNLRREEEVGIAGAAAGAGVGASREERRGEGYDTYENTSGAGTGFGNTGTPGTTREGYDTTAIGNTGSTGATREGYDTYGNTTGTGTGIGTGIGRTGEGYDSYGNTTGTGTGPDLSSTGAIGTTSDMGNAGLTGSTPGGTAPGADGYEHAHAPGTGLRGAEYGQGNVTSGAGTQSHNYSDSGVGGVGDETTKGQNIGEDDENDTTGTKKNPLKKVVDAIKHI